jgi:hypothetical protein
LVIVHLPEFLPTFYIEVHIVPRLFFAVCTHAW